MLAVLCCRAVHALPITGLAVGADACTPCVVSSSLDCTCRIWNGASGHLANTIRLPHPAQCVALAWTEDSIFVGLSDGTIAHTSVNASEAQRQAAEEAAAVEATRREQASEPAQAGECMALMRGHTDAVTCMGQSGDGAYVVSGSSSRRSLFVSVSPRQAPPCLTGYGVRQSLWVAHAAFCRDMPSRLDMASCSLGLPTTTSPLALLRTAITQTPVRQPRTHSVPAPGRCCAAPAPPYVSSSLAESMHASSCGASSACAATPHALRWRALQQQARCRTCVSPRWHRPNGIVACITGMHCAALAPPHEQYVGTRPAVRSRCRSRSARMGPKAKL